MKVNYLLYSLAIVALCFGGNMVAQQQNASPKDGSPTIERASQSGEPHVSVEKKELIQKLRTQGAHHVEGGCRGKDTSHYAEDISSHNPKVIRRQDLQDGIKEDTSPQH